MRRPEEMEARFLLGEAAEDDVLIADARRIMEDLLAGAPEPARAAMAASPPIRARILARG